MKIAAPLAAVLTVATMLIAGAVVKGIEKGRANEANAEFDRMVESAKSATSDPCGLHPLSLVQPPRDSTRKAVVILGGHEFGEDIFDVALQAREPVKGEKTVRVYIAKMRIPEYTEVIWLAAGTEACRDGYSRVIREYAVSSGPHEDPRRPLWPAQPH